MRFRRRAVGLLLLLLCGLVLTGCGAVRAIQRTERALLDAGISDPSVGYDTDGGVDTVTVTWRASAEDRETIDGESVRIAQVVWSVAPVRFDQLRTTALLLEGSSADRTYLRSQLEGLFGARPPGLDKSVSDLLNVRGIVLTVGLLALFGMAAVALIIVLVLRGRKGRRPPGPGWAPPPSPGSGWPAQPPPPPPQGWAPPPTANPDDPWAAPPR